MPPNDLVSHYFSSMRRQYASISWLICLVQTYSSGHKGRRGLWWGKNRARNYSKFFLARTPWRGSHLKYFLAGPCLVSPKCTNSPPWQGKSHSNSSQRIVGVTKKFDPKNSPRALFRPDISRQTLSREETQCLSGHQALKIHGLHTTL